MVQPARLCSRHKHPMALFSLCRHHKYSLNFSKSTKTNHIALRSPDHHCPAWRHCQHAAWYSSSATSRGASLVQQYKDRESPSQGDRLEWVSHRTFPPENRVCIQFLTTSQEKLAFKLCNIRRWTYVNDCLMYHDISDVSYITYVRYFSPKRNLFLTLTK